MANHQVMPELHIKEIGEGASTAQRSRAPAQQYIQRIPRPPGLVATNYRIVAVIVTYYPERERLDRLLTVLRCQVHAVVIVDNGTTPPLQLGAPLSPDALPCLLPLGSNQGVAAALNRGIAWAKAQAATHVLLLDQDSLPAPDMVSGLVVALERLTGLGLAVAAVGPFYQDNRLGDTSPFVRLRGLRLERLNCNGQQEWVEVTHLITSGSLIPISVLEAVGGMEEGLYIDYVDVEWCLRAATRGYLLYGVCTARMEHRLGTAPLSLWGRRYPMREPHRHYYLTRNALLLYRRQCLPWSWKLADGGRLLIKLLLALLFVRPRRQLLRMILLGVKHGLTGRAGPLDTSRVVWPAKAR